ncbi:MAG: hypothetical protein JJU29_04260 [Verrucomicrobia bacterium]|nr:hypothetical protein [Verrucomicrobiota bacterium]MCH8512048.1 hypothetical protein [Kiritimatiellia bacterium]
MKKILFVLSAFLLLPLANLLAESDPEVLPESSPDRPAVREVYIPYEEFREVFERTDRGVFLPYDEFRALVDAAREAGTVEAPKGPKGVLIQEISGVAEVMGTQMVRVQATIILDALNPAWHELDLGLQSVTVSKATINGEPARLNGNAREGYVLLLDHREEAAKRYELELTFVAPLMRAEEGNRMEGVTRGHGFRFSLPSAPVSRWEVVIPEPGVELATHPPLAIANVPDADEAKETRVEIFLASTPTLDVRWMPRVDGAEGMDAHVQATVNQWSLLYADFTRTTVYASLAISRAPIESISFRVPESERVVDASAPGLRSWRVRETETGQVVDLEFLEGVRGDRNVTLVLENHEVDAERRVPQIEVVDAITQRGGVGVGLDTGLRGEVVSREGLQRMDPARFLPNRSPRPQLDFVYEYRAVPFALTVSVSEVEPSIVSRMTTAVRLEPLEMRLNVVAEFDVRRAGVFHLDLDIPDEYELSNLRVSTGPTLDGHTLGDPEDGRRALRVSFASRAQGKVILQFQLRNEQAEAALMTPTGEEVIRDVPFVRAAGDYLASDEGHVLVSAPGLLNLRVHHTENLRAVPWAEAGAHARQLSGAATQFAFQYASEPPKLELAASRKAPHVTVGQLFTIMVEPGVARFEAHLFAQIRYSGISELRVDLPAELSERIQIQNPEFRRRVLDDAPDLEEGMVAWIVERPADMIGDVNIPFAWETPLEGVDVGKEQVLDLPRLIPRNVDRAWGQIVLRKAGSLDIAVSEASASLTPVDPRHDLMQGKTYADAAMAFEFHRDWHLRAVVTRYEPAPLKSTAIERALVRQVFTRGGQTAVQAIYRIRSTRQRLEVRLPEDVEFDAQPLRINGRPIILERGAEGHVYIPLPGVVADEAFLLELRYTLPGGPGRIRLPTFVGDTAVQEVNLSLHLPENDVYLGHRGDWNPEFIWRVGEGFRLMPRSGKGPRELLNWVAQGVSVDVNSLDQMPVAGQHLLFSSLMPDTRDITLRLSRVPLILFYGVVILSGFLLGLFLVQVKLVTRLLVSALLVSGLVLASVFFPSFTRAIVNDATAAAAAMVVVLWIVWDLTVRWPRYRQNLRLQTVHGHQAEKRPIPVAVPRTATSTVPKAQEPEAQEPKAQEQETKPESKSEPNSGTEEKKGDSDEA